MVTLYITHPDCLLHKPEGYHPESPERLAAINAILKNQEFDGLVRKYGIKNVEADLLRVHTPEHVNYVLEAAPNSGVIYIDRNTYLSPKSVDAALYSAGCVVKAVDEVIAGKVNNAFCAGRPPGHHAASDNPSGYCLFNNVAVGAVSALEKYKLNRVAIIDFDVHHGDGTQDIAWGRKEIFFASLHQEGIFPGKGFEWQKGKYNNVLNMPLEKGANGERIKQVFNENLLPRLEEFEPEMVFISAGYDAHWQDSISELNLVEEDFAWMTQELLNVANKYSDGKLVAVLEGGYNPKALANSVAATLRVMMNG